MGDTPRWNGGKLGPYHVGRRYRRVPPDLGRVYEAHHVETGASALVVVPDKDESWAPTRDWRVSAQGSHSPPFLAAEVERAPEASPESAAELTLLFHRLAGVFAAFEGRPDALHHLTGTLPRDARHLARWRPRLRRLGHAVCALALAVLFWPGSASHEQHLTAERHFARTQLADPLPSKPYPDQAKPPCKSEWAEVEIQGGCWVELSRRPPCGKTTEHAGKCYLPSKAEPRPPQSLTP
ncbi:hypothetical protein [Archangium primigenium]|uniref:hypothetical protein n=1 Tax=[Archangium] primigenium TaxID=2792470 RepID=UPI00195CE42E|nr:hypothetical protein [Archangium primigenium]MBM7119414.1 hypothetical protein [Archangium primigenium]